MGVPLRPCTPDDVRPSQPVQEHRYSGRAHNVRPLKYSPHHCSNGAGLPAVRKLDRFSHPPARLVDPELRLAVAAVALPLDGLDRVGAKPDSTRRYRAAPQRQTKPGTESRTQEADVAF